MILKEVIPNEWKVGERVILKDVTSIRYNTYNRVAKIKGKFAHTSNEALTVIFEDTGEISHIFTSDLLYVDTAPTVESVIEQLDELSNKLPIIRKRNLFQILINYK